MWIVGAPRMRFLRGAFVYVEEPTRCINCLLCRPVARRCALWQFKWCSQQGVFFILLKEFNVGTKLTLLYS